MVVALCITVRLLCTFIWLQWSYLFDLDDP